MWHQLLEGLAHGDTRSLARAISLVESNHEGYLEFLQSLPAHDSKIIGITGAPGAGKSTLVDALIGALLSQGKKVAVACVDPSSPFNHGALLGDRIRMSDWYLHPDVFIRSIATRGSLGGLSPTIIEITDVFKAAAYDYIIVETVGVGQSEVEIAGLADVTVVVIVPEGGDEIQTMKAGVMEIADIFVVNKADRPGADLFVNNLKKMWAPAFSREHKVEIIQTVASEKKGIGELITAIHLHLDQSNNNERKYQLLGEKAYQLIQHHRMMDVNKSELSRKIKEQEPVNLYKFILQYIS